MLNCIENTLKLLFDNYLTAAKLLNFQNNLTWPNSITAGISLDSRLKYSKITHRYAKNSPFTCFLYWKLPTDTDFIHFICQFHQSWGINARECFHGPVAPQQGMLGALIVWWPASFWLQWTMTEGTVHASSPAKFPTKSAEEWKKGEMYAIKQIKICAEYRDMLPRPRLVCQEPGLRPIGRSPGVPDKSGQILICITKDTWFVLLIRNMNCAITYIYVHKKLSCLW